MLTPQLLYVYITLYYTIFNNYGENTTCLQNFIIASGCLLLNMSLAHFIVIVTINKGCFRVCSFVSRFITFNDKYIKICAFLKAH